jgi:hypothetical protein
MTVTRAVAATAMLAGLAVGTASTAWASPSDRTPQMSGHYVETDTAQNGQTTTGDWYFTPCGDGCASAANTPGGRSLQVQLVGGKWTMDTTDPAQCPDGTQVPNALRTRATWDPKTLAGTGVSSYIVSACGQPAGLQQRPFTIQLRQAP